MNAAEFTALKARLVERARQVIDCSSISMKGVDGGIRYHRMPKCLVASYNSQLIVHTPSKNYLTNKISMVKIYDEEHGTERPVGMNHRELVEQYTIALAEIDKELLLEDLARV